MMVLAFLLFGAEVHAQEQSSAQISFNEIVASASHPGGNIGNVQFRPDGILTLDYLHKELINRDYVIKRRTVLKGRVTDLKTRINFADPRFAYVEYYDAKRDSNYIVLTKQGRSPAATKIWVRSVQVKLEQIVRFVEHGVPIPGQNNLARSAGQTRPLDGLRIARKSPPQILRLCTYAYNIGAMLSGDWGTYQCFVMVELKFVDRSISFLLTITANADRKFDQVSQNLFVWKASDGDCKLNFRDAPVIAHEDDQYFYVRLAQHCRNWDFVYLAAKNQQAHLRALGGYAESTVMRNLIQSLHDYNLESYRTLRR